MREFSKTICLNNILFLAKQKSIKIGDLETAANVSPGYISRLNKEENNANPGIEFLVSVANVLNVSLEGLFTRDYTTIAPTERYYLEFLDKLNAETTALQLIWNVDRLTRFTGEYGSSYYGTNNPLLASHKLNETSPFPRFILDHQWDEYDALIASNGSVDEDGKVRYESLFTHSKVVLAGDIYNVEIKPDQILYLTKIEVSVDVNNTTTEYELYLFTENSIRPMCKSGNLLSPFLLPMSDLYEAAAVSSAHPNVDLKCKNLIDEFMKE